MSRLLLLSNSTLHGQGYLDHCEAAVRAFLGDCRRIYFLPYARHDRDGYARKAIERLAAMGLRCASLHQERDPRAALAQADAVFVGGGNSFRLLDALQRDGLDLALRQRVAAGLRYMGASAGTNMACPTLKTTNDMPIVQPRSFDALGLIPFQINPHYLDPDPSSTHMGETRETRIREYLEANELPVLGLREGCWLEIEGRSIRLRGPRPARLFRRAEQAAEYASGSDLSFLAAT